MLTNQLKKTPKVKCIVSSIDIHSPLFRGTWTIDASSKMNIEIRRYRSFYMVKMKFHSLVNTTLLMCFFTFVISLLLRPEFATCISLLPSLWSKVVWLRALFKMFGVTFNNDMLRWDIWLISEIWCKASCRAMPWLQASTTLMYIRPTFY